MPLRKNKKRGGADEEEDDFMNLSNISGDENNSLHLSDLDMDNSQVNSPAINIPQITTTTS